MKKKAQELDFEEAAKLRDQIQLIKNHLLNLDKFNKINILSDVDSFGDLAMNEIIFIVHIIVLLCIIGGIALCV